MATEVESHNDDEHGDVPATARVITHDALDSLALREALPAAMLAANRWLLWKLIIRPNGDEAKVPFYTDGTLREGALDTPEDTARLTGFDAACAAANARGVGLGFALGDGFQGIDLDKHREPDGGQLTALATRVVDECNSYTEISPSGKGVHIIGMGAAFAAIGAASNDKGVEAYSGKRYFTVTGRALRNAGELADLRPVVERLRVECVRRNGETVPMVSEGNHPAASIPQGRRDATLTSVAGKLRRMGCNEQEIRAFLIAYNQRCKPPLDEHSIARIARSVANYPPGATVLARPLVAGPDASACGDLRGDDIPPIPFAIKRILPLTIARLFGAGKLGKTTVYLHMAIHVVTGRPWFGFEIERPGPVLIITAEDDEREVRYRLQRLARELALTDEEYDRVEQDIHIEDFSGSTLGRIVMADEYGRLEEGPVVQEIVEQYRDRNLSLVILDPLSLLGPGERFVNDGEIEVARVGRRLVAALNAALIVVHHVSQAVARLGIIDQHGGRGGTAGADNSRAVWQLAPVPEGDGEPPEVARARADDNDNEVMALHFHAVSYGPPVREPLYLVRKGWKFEALAVAAAPDTPAVRDEQERNAALAALLRHMTANHRDYTRDELVALTRPRSIARAALDRAVGERLVIERQVTTGGRPRAMYRLAPAQGALGDGG